MNVTRASRRVKVTGDGKGVASHAGALLVAELADRVGLTGGLSAAMAHTRRRRSAHDPGVVLAHLAVSLADGGDCLADIAVLRNQPDLFGLVASDPTVWRVIDSIHADGLRNIATARAEARARVWAAGGAPETIVIDIDGTLLDAHSEKHDAASTYKHGFGFYPIVAFLDESGEALAGLLRPGNAGSNNAEDHLTVLDRSLAQLPVIPAETPMLVRVDSAGATHAFVDGCAERGVRFSIGLPVDQRVRDALLLAQEEDWEPAVEVDGTARPGAWVVELTDLIDFDGWPEATRVIARRERPHPGAQLSIFDHDEGFRHQVFITDQPDPDIAGLELRHRHRAHVENRIRAAKDTGLRNLPCVDVVCNDAWLQLVLTAQDLTAWMQALCFDGGLAIAEPKRLRHRVFHAAAAIAHRWRGRRAVPTDLAVGHRHRHRVHTHAHRVPRLNKPAVNDVTFAKHAPTPVQTSGDATSTSLHATPGAPNRTHPQLDARSPRNRALTRGLLKDPGYWDGTAWIAAAATGARPVTASSGPTR